MSKQHKTWAEQNEQYLKAAVELLRWHLQNLIAARKDVALQKPNPESLEQIKATMDACLTSNYPPALPSLAQRFGLSSFEYSILLLCLAMELDTGIAKLCGQAHDNPSQNYPTFSLAFRLFGQDNWRVISPESPLRYWRFIEIIQAPNQPLMTSPLRIDERILNHAKGLQYLDDRLMPYVIEINEDESSLPLPPSQAALVEKTVHFFQTLPPSYRLPIVQLLGNDVNSKHYILAHIAKQLGWKAYQLSAALIPENVIDVDNFARLWQRETLITPLILYIDNHDSQEPAIVTRLERFFNRSTGLYFLGQHEPYSIHNRATLKLDVNRPTANEQRTAWKTLVGQIVPDAPPILAGQFDLALPTIHHISQVFHADKAHSSQNPFLALWEECMNTTRPQLDTLAQRIVPKATFDDIVLPEQQLSLLQLIVEQVRFRSTVYDEWGFREKMSRGLGMIVLFSGDSGTGKTMAAEVIANTLHLDLYRIDLSSVVSKYIGETEKNLRRLFDAAEGGGVILFFDEADAIFGKRSQVKDSRDRYANIETNYLLQRLEAYQGLAILSTNLRSNMDDAFSRRIRFIVNFPFPEEESRKRIWQKVFPPQTPLDTLDYDFLARFNLAGGSIYNAALNAAFIAASEAIPVNMYHILDCIRIEFQKSNRLIDERELEWQPN